MNMFLEKPKIFRMFPQIKFVMSQKYQITEFDDFEFNMSKSISDDETRVLKNRSKLFEQIGLDNNSVIIQKQIHSDIVNVVDRFHNNLIGDALITSKKNLGLAISTADCNNIYIFESKNNILAAVHSGWEGTEKSILDKTIKRMFELGADAKSIFAFFGPSICQEHYEVGKEFKNKFDPKYLKPIKSKYLLDLKLANKEILTRNGINEENIEISSICSYKDRKYHSYRRDKLLSGRALGVIAMVDTNEN